MQTNILITNGGPHSPEKWALATAASIMPINPDMDGERLLAAQKLQTTVAEALVAHHADAQSHERAMLEAKGDARLAEEIEVEDRVAEALKGVRDAAKGTFWEAHVLSADAQAEMDKVLTSHFATVHQIERDWHVARKQG